MQRNMVLVAIVGIVAAGCSAGGSGSPASSATALPSPSSSRTVEPAPSATETTPPTMSEAPSPTMEAIIAIDTVVATTVEDLSVRRTPGTGGERIGFLSLGTVAYVLEGPIDVDGVPWSRIIGLGLPYASGCVTTPPDQPISCPAFHGWVAAANDAGDPWLAPTDPGDCPQPTIESISESGFTWRLICWADEDITSMPGGQSFPTMPAWVEPADTSYPVASSTARTSTTTASVPLPTRASSSTAWR